MFAVKRRLAAALLTTLLATLACSAVIPQGAHALAWEGVGWKTIQTEDITITFPLGGRKPIFLWWRTEDPSVVYAVEYEGLIEYFTLIHPFYMSRYAVTEKNFQKLLQLRGLSQKRLQGVLVSFGHLLRGWHPAYFPFSAAEWRVEDIQNITTADGHVIGISFAFKLVRVRIPWFKFAENNIMIRCRFYYEPVTERVDDLYEYSVAAGEMKMDFVVERWKWNLGSIEPLLTALKKLNITLPEHASGLALWVNLATFNFTDVEAVKGMPEMFGRVATTSHIMVGNQLVAVRLNRTGLDERPIPIPKRLREFVRLQFATEDTTLAGYFKFVASAKLTNATGTYVVPVTASYIEAGAHMRLYICYPYFGDGSLEHDPSIGLEAPTPPSTTTPPQHLVEVPTGRQTIPKAMELPAPPLPIVTHEMVVAVVVAASLVAAALLAAGRRPIL